MTELERRSPRELITKATNRGVLSTRSSSALQRPEIDREVRLALEASYSVKSTGTILLVTMMPDDSYSMVEPQGESGTKRDSVISGHNELLDAMATSRDRGRILWQTRYLNRTVLNPFSPLTKCTRMTIENCPSTSSTPLYEQTLVLLGTILVKTEELVELGAKVRTATLIMTDGESTEVNKVELARDVACVVQDMKQLGDHIVAGMSITSAGDKFSQPFLDMGIDPGYIFSATSREEILEVFRVFRKRVIGELTSGTPTRRVFDL